MDCISQGVIIGIGICIAAVIAGVLMLSGRNKDFKEPPDEEAHQKMLEALQNLENDDGIIPDHAWKLVQDAINCALARKK